MMHKDERVGFPVTVTFNAIATPRCDLNCKCDNPTFLLVQVDRENLWYNDVGITVTHKLIKQRSLPCPKEDGVYRITYLYDSEEVKAVIFARVVDGTLCTFGDPTNYKWDVFFGEATVLNTERLD